MFVIADSGEGRGIIMYCLDLLISLPTIVVFASLSLSGGRRAKPLFHFVPLCMLAHTANPTLFITKASSVFVYAGVCV